MPTPDLDLSGFLATLREHHELDTRYDRLDAIHGRLEARAERLQARLLRVCERQLRPLVDRTNLAAQGVLATMKQVGLAAVLRDGLIIVDVSSDSPLMWFNHLAVIRVEEVVGLAERLRPEGGSTP